MSSRHADATASTQGLVFRDFCPYREGPCCLTLVGGVCCYGTKRTFRIDDEPEHFSNYGSPKWLNTQWQSRSRTTAQPMRR